MDQVKAEVPVVQTITGEVPAMVEGVKGRTTDLEFYQLPFNQWPLDERLRLCTFLAQSNSIPSGDRGNPANIYFKAERGARLGLSPTESVSHILVVNGATSVWGDMGLALVRRSGLLAAHDEWWEVDGRRLPDDDLDLIELSKQENRKIVAKVMMQRKGEAPKTVSYSVQDARDAGLWASKDVWKKSPKRMMMWRPRSFVMRDKFPDVLMGFITVEEAMDITPDAEQGAIAAQSSPETKGAEVLGEITDATGAASQAVLEETRMEVEMLESILMSGGRAEKAAEIARELRIEATTMTQEQGALYVRALGLAIDAMNADADRAAAALETKGKK